MVHDLPGDLMAHNTGAGERDFSFHDMEVRVADTTSCTSLSTPCEMKHLRKQSNSSEQALQHSDMPHYQPQSCHRKNADSQVQLNQPLRHLICKHYHLNLGSS
jgi:hypothetical protein